MQERKEADAEAFSPSDVKVVRAYDVVQAGELVGRFLNRTDAEVLRDEENAKAPIAIFKVKIRPHFLLEAKQEDGTSIYFDLWPVQVSS